MNGNGVLADFQFQDHPIDENRPLNILIIGAGVSGILLYIRLLQYVPNAKVHIVEKNSDVGGTWYENRYPGVACDIPSHVYQYSFEPNTQWSRYFSPGAEIFQYVKKVAQKYKVAQKVHYNTKVVGMTWDEGSAAWRVMTAKTLSDGSVIEQTKDFHIVISAVGTLNNWRWPDIKGLHNFEGQLLHSANWDASWDYTGKQVALLGCGSSAIQILPHLAKKCDVVHNFVRGGTWISQPFGSTFTENALSKGDEPGNYRYTEEELQNFERDSVSYNAFRKKMECAINGDFPCLFPGSSQEIAGTQAMKDRMRTELAVKPGLYEALEPKFTPGCRRLTPGPGYLEALTKDHVNFIKTPIVKITKNAVQTSDGREVAVDAIVCATGFDSSYMPRFPITGRNGITIQTKWKDHSCAYLSHSVPSFPNLFFVAGPNSATGGGSLLVIFESIISYVVKAVQKISREHIQTMEVKNSALESWKTYITNYFPRTVHVDECTSWYKVNGRITGLWPGSSVHAKTTLDHPRWEDFEYSYSRENAELEWLGNGWTMADRDRGDLGFYLDYPDVPPVPSDELMSTQP